MSWIIQYGNYPLQESWDLTVIFPEEPKPSGLFLTNENYPMFESYKPDSVPENPKPNGLFITDVNYPMFESWKLSNMPGTPLPEGVFVTQKDYPKFITWELSTLGAFNRTPVELVKTSSTLKTVERYSFKDTPLSTVSLPQFCTYYKTSFPEGCDVQGGNLINNS